MLTNFNSNNSVFDKDKLIDELLEYPFIRNFFLDNDLGTEDAERHLLPLLQFMNEKKCCTECKSYDECKLDVRGLEPHLEYSKTNRAIRKNYSECNLFKNRLRTMEIDSNVDAMHMPKSIYISSLEDYDFKRGENRVDIFKTVNDIIGSLKKSSKTKGLYLHGRYGVGKTYILSSIANELIKNDIKVIIAYYPDLVREFKSRVSDNSLEQLISKLKQVDVLMLDDIGAEGKSVWVRDEVLGPILQFRLLDSKTTMFSSNMSIKDLTETHFSKFTPTKETMRAFRIGTRIKDLVGENEFKL